MSLTRVLPIALCAALAACGSRTMPSFDDQTTTAAGCTSAADCIGPDLCTVFRCEAYVCVPAASIDCDDGDPCTIDRCVPE
jgi:hypothetical protein